MSSLSLNPLFLACWRLLRRKWRRLSTIRWMQRRRISLRPISGLRKKRARCSLRPRAITIFCRIILKSSLNRLSIPPRTSQQLSIQQHTILQQYPMSMSTFLRQWMFPLLSQLTTFLQPPTTLRNTFRPFLSRLPSFHPSNKPYKSSQPTSLFSQ